MWVEILILAVVQGIAEFLPVGSSAHVAIGLAVGNQFGHPVREMLTVNIILHFGTLPAILLFYWRRVRRLLDKDRRVTGLPVGRPLLANLQNPQTPSSIGGQCRRSLKAAVPPVAYQNRKLHEPQRCLLENGAAKK